MPKPYHTVGRVAAMTRLTVRALHHYDAIGLVCPSHRGGNGYRLYTEDDLRRLQQVLLLRELGFGLEAVRELIDAPPGRRREALLAQRTLLETQQRHTETMMRAVDATLQSLTTDTPMSIDKLFDGCENFANGEYAQEAEQRWGQSTAWKESKRRTGGYGKDDWTAIEREAETIVADFLAAMQRGDAADSDAATAIAERHRLHIDRWFYPCSHAMHRNVSAMYTADPRFQAYYDRHGDGLAAYVEAAVHANAARVE
ncbi:MAG: MerR family transcriptional regulator [Lysobacteraceae bacterium]|nr:MAG: MerR family transcriptional regulator [Xanthomonadaceae bacterium]